MPKKSPKSTQTPAPRRVLFKLSGEALGGEQGTNIEPSVVEAVVKEVKKLCQSGIEIGMVLGGGNLFRGAKLESLGIDRSTGDQMGMLATIMNALVLRDTLEAFGVKTRILSAVNIEGITEPFDHRMAKRYLAEGELVIFSGGTGNPYFTTDTAATLRGIEIEADLILKATKVDYVYDKDPRKHKDAKPFKTLSYKEVLERGLNVMDLTAVTLAMEHQKPLRVFSMEPPSNLSLALEGKIGTFIS